MTPFLISPDAWPLLFFTTTIFIPYRLHYSCSYVSTITHRVRMTPVLRHWVLANTCWYWVVLA